MKNTMKKLLCMALAIMLLVSAVPVFAAADGETIDVPVQVTIDGTPVGAPKKITVTQGAENVVLNASVGMGLLQSTEGREFDKWIGSDGHEFKEDELGYEFVSGFGGNYSLTLALKSTGKSDEDDNGGNGGNGGDGGNDGGQQTPPPAPTKYTVSVSVKVGEDESDVRRTSFQVDDGTDIADRLNDDLIRACVSDYSSSKYTKGTWWISTGSSVVNADTTVAIRVTPVPVQPTTTQVTFVAKNNAGETVTNQRDFTAYEVVSSEKLPSAPLRVGYKFMGWYSGQNGTGDHLAAGDKWSGEHTTYYAWYKESKTEDGMSTLSVYLRRYVGGVQQGSTELLYTHDFVDNKSDSLLTWLQNNETTTSNAIFGKYSAEEYEWAPRYYYNYSGNEPLTSQDLVADGDKSVVVKVYAKSSAKATVLIYTHPSKTSTSVSVYEMPGYKAGNTVTLSAVKNFLNNTKITGLYSDAAWAQLKNGENPTAANGIAVEDNGILRIHVIGSAKSSSSNADTSNPKTGDTIFVPVMVMGLTGSVLAAAYVFGKKRFAR